MFFCSSITLSPAQHPLLGRSLQFLVVCVRHAKGEKKKKDASVDMHPVACSLLPTSTRRANDESNSA